MSGTRKKIKDHQDYMGQQSQQDQQGQESQQDQQGQENQQGHQAAGSTVRRLIDVADAMPFGFAVIQDREPSCECVASQEPSCECVASQDGSLDSPQVVRNHRNQGTVQKVRSSQDYGTILTVNRKLCEMCGCESKEEFLAYTWGQFRNFINPYDYQILQGAAHEHNYYRLRAKDGTDIHVEDTEVRTEDPEYGSVILLYLNSFGESRNQNIFDLVTGLYQKEYLYHWLREQNEYNPEMFQDHPMAVVYLNCRDFRIYNDTFGYEAGNQFLKSLGEKIEEVLCTTMAARIYADQFVAYCDATRAEAGVREIHEWALGEIGEKTASRDISGTSGNAAGNSLKSVPGKEAGNSLKSVPGKDAGNSLRGIPGKEAGSPLRSISGKESGGPAVSSFQKTWVTAGIFYPQSWDQKPETVMDYAKIACDRIPVGSPDYINIYSDDLAKKIEKREYIQAHVDEAAEKGWLVLFLQPVIRTLSGKVCSAEALARWIDPKYGMISPGEFVPALEEKNLSYKLALFVIDAAARMISDAMHRNVPVFPLSINFSRKDFDVIDPFEEVEKAVFRYGIQRSSICIEITESMAMEDPVKIQSVIARFHKAGYEVWMDDFGSAYSSLNTLKDFDFDEIKLDMVFMRGLNDKAREIVESCVNMSKRLGIHTLCEGVETAEQVEFLRDIGCEKIQGFYYSKPRPPKELNGFLGEKGLRLENGTERHLYDSIGHLLFTSKHPWMLTMEHGDTEEVIYQSPKLRHDARMHFERKKQTPVNNSPDHSSEDRRAYVPDSATGSGAIPNLPERMDRPENPDQKETPNPESSGINIDVDENDITQRLSTVIREAVRTGREEELSYFAGGHYYALTSRVISSFHDISIVRTVIRDTTEESKQLLLANADPVTQSLVNLYDGIYRVNSETQKIEVIASDFAGEKAGMIYPFSSKMASTFLYWKDRERFLSWMKKLKEEAGVFETEPGGETACGAEKDADVSAAGGAGESGVNAAAGVSEPEKVTAAAGGQKGTSKKERGLHDPATGIFRIRHANGSYGWEAITFVPCTGEEEGEYLICLRPSVEQPTGQDDWSGELLWQAMTDQDVLKLFWKDRERRFVGVSQAFLRYYGFSSFDEIAGKTDEEIGWHVNDTDFREIEENILRTGHPMRDAETMIVLNGRMHRIRATKFPISRNGEIIGLMGYFYDLDETPGMVEEEIRTFEQDATGRAGWRGTDGTEQVEEIREGNIASPSVMDENTNLITSPGVMDENTGFITSPGVMDESTGFMNFADWASALGGLENGWQTGNQDYEIAVMPIENYWHARKEYGILPAETLASACAEALREEFGGNVLFSRIDMGTFVIAKKKEHGEMPFAERLDVVKKALQKEVWCGTFHGRPVLSYGIAARSDCENLFDTAAKAAEFLLPSG